MSDRYKILLIVRSPLLQRQTRTEKCRNIIPTLLQFSDRLKPQTRIRVSSSNLNLLQ
ncbi:hypothetical protein [Nostoc sp.]|uniref:hypothetical protein n=1 Tax=Nostoc sp. TaxID=1180 RepID=UPI002FF51408